MAVWLAAGLLRAQEPGAGRAGMTMGRDPSPEGATNVTTVTAQRLSFDYKRYIAVFEEDVIVEDPEVRIEADKLVVIFDQANEIRSATALGNVRIRNEDRVATCGKAIYIKKNGEVILTVDPELKRGDDMVKGDKITFWLNEDRMVCEPGMLVIHSGDEGGSKGIPGLE